MSTHQVLLAELKSVIVDDIKSALTSIENSATRAHCDEWAQDALKSLETLLRTVTDEGDAQYAIAMRYASMKATWIELNTVLNYQVANGDEADEKQMQLAGFVSGLLGRLERHVHPEALQRITHMLTDPINS